MATVEQFKAAAQRVNSTNIAAAVNATSAIAVLADDDKIAATDTSASGILGWLTGTVLWTYIKAKIDAGMTIAGIQAFSSTTRPTSAGTGTPATTSLITRADGDTRYFQALISHRTTDTSIISTTTETDTGLTVAVEANSTYLVESLTTYQMASTTPGVVEVPSYPSGTTELGWGMRETRGGFGAVGAGPELATFAIGATANCQMLSRFEAFFTRRGIITTSGTAGNYKLQYKQNTSSADFTQIKAGSYLKLTKLA